jgi:hypothetical protein
MLDRSGITEKDWEIFKTLPKERLDGYTIINLLKLSVDAPPKTRSTLIKLFTLQEHWVQEQISQSDPVHTAQFFGKAKPTRPETVMDFLRKEAFGLLSPTLNWFLVATRKGGGMTGLLKMFGQGLLTSILSGFVMDVAMSAMVGDVIDFEALAKASYSDQLKVAGKWFLHGGLSFWAIERFVNMFFVESYYIAAAFGGLGLSVGAATKQVDLFFNLIDTAIFLEQKEGEKQSAFEGRKARRIASITEKMEKSKMPVYLQAIWQKIVTQAVNVTVDDLESVYEEYYKRKLTKYQETFHKPMGGETVPTQKDKSGGRRWVKEQTAKKIGEGEKKKEKGRSKSQASTKGKPAPSKERGMVLEPIGG